MLLHTVQMNHQRPHSSIVGVGQSVDDCMKRVASDNIIIDARRRDKLIVPLSCEQWIGQVSKELFQQSSHGIDVVVESCWIAKVDARAVVVEDGFELLYVRVVSGQAVYAFNIETEKINRLHTLIHDHWYGGAVALKQLLEIETKDRSHGRWEVRGHG